MDDLKCFCSDFKVLRDFASLAEVALNSHACPSTRRVTKEEKKNHIGRKIVPRRLKVVPLSTVPFGPVGRGPNWSKWCYMRFADPIGLTHFLVSIALAGEAIIVSKCTSDSKK